MIITHANKVKIKYRNVIICGSNSFSLHSKKMKGEIKNVECNNSFKIIHKELCIENCRFYNLRGSYATINLRNGIEIRDVADILGHKYIETTENFYISSTDETRKKV
jgi:site-specific recombinase XerD